jgi:2'-5' RNA ligase
VEDFRLYSSWLGPAGATYVELATYPLASADVPSGGNAW